MEEGNTAEREFLDADQVSDLLRVSRFTVVDWWQRGQLAGFRLGHRTIRFARVDVEAFLAARREGPR